MSRRFALICAALFTGTIFRPTVANATITVNITQNGPDVVATASGTLNLTGLSFQTNTNNIPAISPQFAYIGVGGSGLVDIYAGLTGPGQFGSGGSTLASTSAGDPFAIWFPASAFQVWVPNGYLSGSQISSTATFAGMSFASLGLTPGQYVYSTRSDSVTVNVVAVPEPVTWVMLILGFGAVGFGFRRRNGEKITRSA